MSLSPSAACTINIAAAGVPTAFSGLSRAHPGLPSVMYSIRDSVSDKCNARSTFSGLARERRFLPRRRGEAGDGRRALFCQVRQRVGGGPWEADRARRPSSVSDIQILDWTTLWPLSSATRYSGAVGGTCRSRPGRETIPARQVRTAPGAETFGGIQGS